MIMSSDECHRTDDKSTLVQVMAWCRQATSHYLNQCWPRSPTPYGITRPPFLPSDAIWLLVGTELEPEQQWSPKFCKCFTNFKTRFYHSWYTMHFTFFVLGHMGYLRNGGVSHCLFCVTFYQPGDVINSSWPRNIIWWRGSESALAQVMAWCLMAPSH